MSERISLGKAMGQIVAGVRDHYLSRDRAQGIRAAEAMVDLIRHVEALEGTLSYLRTQASNGTLHPQVVIQNVNKAIGPAPPHGEGDVMSANQG